MTEIKAGLKDVIVAQSTLSFIDGNKGELVYAGININELAQKSNFEEVVYLLLHQKLPTQAQLDELDQDLKKHRAIPEEILQLLKSLPQTMEPMAAFRTAVSALAAYDPNPKDTSIKAQQDRVIQLVAQMATIVAAQQRIHNNEAPIAPNSQLGHSANFLYMLTSKEPDPTATKAMDIALILHADHGFNASTFAARVTTSTLSDVYSAVTSAIGTLKGPLHGGANQRVMEMLLEIGDSDPVEFVKKKIANKEKIMGFGHRVYRTEDPRATHLRRMSEELCTVTGNPKWYQMSRRIEEFINAEKNLNANVDFYSASVYYSLGIPPELFTLLFAMSRIAGWGAHILEQYENNRLIRPREEYIGPRNQAYMPISDR